MGDFDAEDGAKVLLRSDLCFSNEFQLGRLCTDQIIVYSQDSIARIMTYIG